MDLSIFPENIDVKYGENEIAIDDLFYTFSRPHFKVSENDFFLDVKDVAQYRVRDGLNIQVNPYENADEESVTLFLEGSVLGALLHQRGIIPFHGSSFSYKGKGILVCGSSGAGKSAVTASFHQQGAVFINDDITPLSFSDDGIRILPIKTRIKLWNDSLDKLKINPYDLNRIRPQMDKFYLPIEKAPGLDYKLDFIFILQSHQKKEYLACKLNGIEKFNVLRRQIYRKVYLKGMPAMERKYFKDLFLLAKSVPVIRIIRPAICDIHDTMSFIEKEIL